MHETSNTMAKNMVGGVCTVELCGWLFDLRWGVGLLLILMLADLWFGCSESKKRGVQIPKSRCIRRTLNKVCDYAAVMMVFLFLGGLLINQPVLGLFVGIAISCVAEICSVGGHILYLKGIKFSFKKFFIALIKFRYNELGSAIEKAVDETSSETAVHSHSYLSHHTDHTDNL